MLLNEIFTANLSARNEGEIRCSRSVDVPFFRYLLAYQYDAP
jgi:hypothetical protein